MADRKILLFFFRWAPVKGQGFLGIQNNMKIRGSLCVSRSRSAANKEQPNLFVKAQKFGIGYFGSLVLVLGILGYYWNPLGVFVGCDFCPHSTHPSSFEIRSNPLTAQNFRVRLLAA